MNLWAQVSPRAKRWEGLALGMVALGCLAFQLRLPSVTPADEDFRGVAAVLESEATVDDVVLLTPWWAERARLFLPQRLLAAGWYGSDAEDFRQHRRIWVLANAKAPKFSWSDFLAVFGRGRREIGAERRFGPLSLRLYSNDRARPLLFSAQRQLAAARVYLESPQGQQPCQWMGRTWLCPNRTEVTEDIRELHFEPHRCLRFNPPGGATKLVAEFRDVPAASVLSLVTGYAWERGAYRQASSTEFGLEVNGASELVTLSAGVEKIYRVDRPNTQSGTVRVWVRADNPENREVCFELHAFGPEA